MGSLLEELARREAAARRRIERLREQIAELTQRLGSEEDRLSRLVITRETVEEILGEAVRLVEEPVDEDESGDVAEPESVRLGVVTVACGDGDEGVAAGVPGCGKDPGRCG